MSEGEAKPDITSKAASLVERLGELEEADKNGDGQVTGKEALGSFIMTEGVKIFESTNLPTLQQVDTDGDFKVDAGELAASSKMDRAIVEDIVKEFPDKNPGDGVIDLAQTFELVSDYITEKLEKNPITEKSALAKLSEGLKPDNSPKTASINVNEVALNTLKALRQDYPEEFERLTEGIPDTDIDNAKDPKAILDNIAKGRIL